MGPALHGYQRPEAGVTAVPTVTVSGPDETLERPIGKTR
jgi:hypothetical protein